MRSKYMLKRKSIDVLVREWETLHDHAEQTESLPTFIVRKQAEFLLGIFIDKGFSKEEAENQFGFLMNAFQYGAPPHGGLAFGLDRLVSILGGQETIRDFIAFPKNNSGRDVMIDAPSTIDSAQLNELHIKLDLKPSN